MTTGVIALLAIIGTAGVIAIVAFCIHKFIHLKEKDDGKPTQDQILKEEMERMLKSVDDADVAKQMAEYKEKNDED